MRYGASSRHMGEPRPAAGVEPGLLAAGLAMALLLMAFGALATLDGALLLRLLSGIRDENGKREILSTSGGEYVIVDCCNDPQKLKAIQRRIQAQMNGLDVSAGKVHGRVHFLERFMGWVRKERSDGAA